MVPLLRCVACRAAGPLARGEPFQDPAFEKSRQEMAVVLGASATFLDSLKVRGATHKGHATGIRAYLRYAAVMNILPFPSHPEDLVGFLNHQVLFQGVQGSTAAGYLDGVEAVHMRLLSLKLIASNPCQDPGVVEAKQTVARNFKTGFTAKRPLSLSQLRQLLEACSDAACRKTTHLRLCIMFIGLGIIRTGAASVIQAHYTVSVSGEVSFLPTSHVQVRRHPERPQETYLYVEVRADKNRNPTMPFREVYLPEHVPALGLHPVREVLDYLRLHRPSSENRFLLAAPRGLAGWSTYKPDRYGVIVGHRPNKSIRTLLATTDHGLTEEELKKIGTTSLRKALSQALKDDGWPRAVRRDLGAWSMQAETMDSYQSTSTTIRLTALAHLGARLGPRYFAAD